MPNAPDPRDAPGVQLPAGESASSLLLSLLREARDRFPGTFGPVALPSRTKELKRAFPSLLIEVEQRRLASPDRAAISAHLRARVLERFVLRDADGRTRPLTALGLAAAPLETSTTRGGAGTGHRPALTYAGQRYESVGLRALVDDLARRRRIDPVAEATLRRALDRVEAGGGALDLSGERFALLGAGAEIAPTRALLEAGATVLWLDIVEPPDELRRAGGTLVHGRGRGDLLLAPDRVAATVAAFVAEAPAHLGLFAYGPGSGREWRLGAAMNAVVAALPPEALRSVGLYVSPTSPAPVSTVDAAEADRRRAHAPLWQRALLASRALAPNRGKPDLPRVADTVVALQGVSYQAAQWLEKTIALEALAAERPSLRISGNVAPVTETRSLEHPLFAAAFRGAPIFGVESFPSEVTRTLCALLYVEDLLGEPPRLDAPRQLHGGLFALPWTLDGAIRVAALRGLAGKA